MSTNLIKPSGSQAWGGGESNVKVKKGINQQVWNGMRKLEWNRKFIYHNIFHVSMEMTQ